MAKTTQLTLISRRLDAVAEAASGYDGLVTDVEARTAIVTAIDNALSAGAAVPQIAAALTAR
jgi:hypothetical protein